MKHLSWQSVDKSGWGKGPWSTEPDKEQWVDDTTGLVCMIRRSPSGGAWCGYVGVEQGHPLREMELGESEFMVHGGITFTGLCEDGPEESSICHVAEPGEPEPLFWIGFDCGHSVDVEPARAARERELGLDPIDFGAQYRDIHYVKSECAALALQIRDWEE